MSKRTFTAAVTFEFPEAAPETWKGEISAVSPQTAAHRALREAKRAFPRRRWSSLVIFLQQAEG